MARKYTVTSTIKATRTTYRKYNTFTEELETTTTFEVPTFTTNTIQEQLKELRKHDFEACKPLNQVETMKLYGMTDETFMSIAKPIASDERRNLITRTVKKAKVNYKAFDITANKTVDMSAYIENAENMSGDKLLKTVRKECETDTVKVISINDIEMIEALYGCTKEAFISNGTLLNPVTRQPYENEQC